MLRCISRFWHVQRLAISWLTTFLIMLFHSMHCLQDNTVHQLLDRDGMLTVGTEERDIEWEAMWRAQLARDDKDSVRNSAPLHHSVAMTLFAQHQRCFSSLPQLSKAQWGKDAPSGNLDAFSCWPR